jgi:hypothetical protein
MVGYSVRVYVGNHTTSLFGVSYAFFWCPFIPKPKTALPTTFATAAGTAYTYDNDYKS